MRRALAGPGDEHRICFVSPACYPPCQTRPPTKETRKSFFLLGSDEERFAVPQCCGHVTWSSRTLVSTFQEYDPGKRLIRAHLGHLHGHLLPVGRLRLQFLEKTRTRTTRTTPPLCTGPLAQTLCQGPRAEVSASCHEVPAKFRQKRVLKSILGPLQAEIRLVFGGEAFVPARLPQGPGHETGKGRDDGPFLFFREDPRFLKQIRNSTTWGPVTQNPWEKPTESK